MFETVSYVPCRSLHSARQQQAQSTRNRPADRSHSQKKLLALFVRAWFSHAFVETKTLHAPARKKKILLGQEHLIIFSLRGIQTSGVNPQVHV